MVGSMSPYQLQIPHLFLQQTRHRPWLHNQPRYCRIRSLFWRREPHRKLFFSVPSWRKLLWSMLLAFWSPDATPTMKTLASRDHNGADRLQTSALPTKVVLHQLFLWPPPQARAQIRLQRRPPQASDISNSTMKLPSASLLTATALITSSAMIRGTAMDTHQHDSTNISLESWIHAYWTMRRNHLVTHTLMTMMNCPKIPHSSIVPSVVIRNMPHLWPIQIPRRQGAVSQVKTVMAQTLQRQLIEQLRCCLQLHSRPLQMRQTRKPWSGHYPWCQDPHLPRHHPNPLACCSPSIRLGFPSCLFQA